MHNAHAFLQTLAMVLCVAAVTTVLFQRLKQPVVLGYLLAGMLVGDYVKVPLSADPDIVKTLAELGVILLMFSLGIEFSLRKLMRVGPTAAFVAIVQCSLMIWLGYLVGQAFGWSRLASVYAGAAISISSTTIIVKAFEEQQIKGEFKHVVFGVLIVEDLIAILMITILTAVSAGENVGLGKLSLTAGKLLLFLVLLVVVGLLTVPRAMRFVVRLDRSETTVVASIGLAFGFALLAAAFGYSVALGAFIAGSLIGESGVEKTVEHLVQPVRDIFAAIFFVSVGMLIIPGEIIANWTYVLTFFVVVVLGMVGSVTVSAILTGQSVQTSVKIGMTLAQIGEFSFIIAGLGMATGATDSVLYSIAVAVSAATTLLTPWLIRWSPAVAAYVDRKLPRALQTFVALYGSWIQQLGASTSIDAEKHRIRRLVRWLLVDSIVVAVIVIGASLQMEDISKFAREHLKISPTLARVLLIAAVVAVSSPFWIGMIGIARYLGFEIANRTFPVNSQTADFAAAPRRLLVVTLQLAIVVLVGLPLVAITQPFLPPLQGAVILLLLLLLLAISFWRRATNFQGHTRAAAQAIIQAIARQTQDGRATEVASSPMADLNKIFAGLGSPTPITLPPQSPAVGKTLADVKLRGLTGATVLAIHRGEDDVVVPAGDVRLLAGDILAVTGTKESLEAARELLEARE